MTTVNTQGLVVGDLWRRQAIWSHAAVLGRRSIERHRTAGLALALGAALLGTASPFVGRWGTAVAISAAVCLALVPFARRGVAPQRIQDCARIRSVAEGLKTEIFRYLAEAPPYNKQRRDDTLRRRTADILARADDLLPLLSGLKPHQPELPAIKDTESYIRLRLQSQIDEYYEPNAAELGAKARLFERAQTLLAIAAAILVALSPLAGAELAAWIGVLATGSGALAAHVAGSRFSTYQLEYLRTAEHLRRLLDEYRMAETDDRMAAHELVVRSERAIAAQNQGWMASAGLNSQLQEALKQ